jgi:hypothetical protein
MLCSSLAGPSGACVCLGLEAGLLVRMCACCSWLLLCVSALPQRDSGCGSGFRIGVAVGLETLDQQQWYALYGGVWYQCSHCTCMNVRGMCPLFWLTMHVLCMLCCAVSVTLQYWSAWGHGYHDACSLLRVRLISSCVRNAVLAALAPGSGCMCVCGRCVSCHDAGRTGRSKPALRLASQPLCSSQRSLSCCGAAAAVLLCTW